ncbi:MAG: CotH kinase family protein [Bacteroidaceae bacterium]|nr:CotH kinase family protein [Bacteroidaceae bacterium]
MRKTIITITALLLFAVSAYTRAQEVSMPVLEIHLTMTIEKGMDYADGTMKLTDTDGKTIELPARFKTRGATAQQYMMKPSLNMKLCSADYQTEVDSTLLGIRSCSSWILDAMAIDRICMRNRVAFDIWNEFSRLPYDTEFGGRNGTEGRFIEMYINDVYYGIYCLSDRINRKLLDLKKVKESSGSMQVRGVLYKSGTSDIENQNEPGYNADYTACTVEWHNAWELTYPDDYASEAIWQPLQDAILNGRSTDYVKKYFYLENLADYQIHTMALAIEDNMGNKNHYLSIRNINKNIDAADPDDANRRRFVLTPWDLDTSLGGNYRGDYYGGNYSDWAVQDVAKNAFYPLYVLQTDDEFKALLKQRWTQARTGALSVESVKQKLEAYRDLFIGSGAWKRMTDHYAQQSDKPMLVDDLETEISLIEQWYENRFRQIDDYFGITDGVDDIGITADPDQPVYYMNGTGAKDDAKGLLIRQNMKFYFE